MRWNDTIASTCRYGDTVGQVFGDAEIIWEDSVADYQGHANIVALLEDGTVLHYEWSYGSCSGCDSWESSGASDQDIMEEVERTMSKMDIDKAISYFHHMPEIQNILKQRRPTVWSPIGAGGGRFGDF
jgi:hypothetical protein